MIKIPLYPHTRYASARIAISRDSKWIVVLGIFVLSGFVVRPWLQVSAKAASPERIIGGIVRDDEGAIPGAVVRIQTMEHSAVTGSEGKFELAVPESFSGPVKLTAWAKGYFIGGPVEAAPGQKDVTISLHRHSQLDNREYEWSPSFRSAGSGENQGCSECHFRGEAVSGPVLPVDEWLKDAHSQSAVNPRFLTLHSGTDMSGRRSPNTRYRRISDNRIVPLPPDPEEPYYGPGYRLDNPDHTGDCGACHVPAAAINAPYNTDPVSVQGVEAEGVYLRLLPQNLGCLPRSRHRASFSRKSRSTFLRIPETFQGASVLCRASGRHRPGRGHIFQASKEQPVLRPMPFWSVLGYGCLRFLRGVAAKPLQPGGEGKDVPGLPYAEHRG